MLKRVVWLLGGGQLGIYDKKLVHSLFEKAKERYGDRDGGYTRIVRTVSRKGDNAQMAIIELV